MAVTPVFLSGSTDGDAIQIAGTAFANRVTLHTSHATNVDEIWITFNNTSATAATLSVVWGDDADTDDNYIIKGFSVPANSPGMCLIQGLRLSGTQTVKAFSGTNNVLNAVGYVNRIA